MVFSLQYYTFVLVFLVQYSVYLASPPTLSPNVSEIYLNEGDPLEINCSSSKKIQFNYPSKTTVYHYTSPVLINEEVSLSSGIQSATLKRNSTVHGDTGWYGCADFDVVSTPNTHDGPDFTWTYVYVKSNTNWFVSSEDFESLQVKLGDSVVLGCRPTSPSYLVNLYDSYDLKINDRPSVSFDPKLGFTLKNTSLIDSGYYKCVIQNDNNEQEVNYHLTVVRNISDILYKI